MKFSDITMKSLVKFIINNVYLQQYLYLEQRIVTIRIQKKNRDEIYKEGSE